MFFLAGTRHRCSRGELFYAGIGGHLEEGEDWIECVQREAREEIGTDVEILPSSTTWYLPQGAAIQQLEVIDQPRPFAFYEMIHPERTPRAGGLYHIVIYKAKLHDLPKNLPLDEVQGIIALTKEQVIQGAKRKATLAELLVEGASIVAGSEGVDKHTRLYPIGTALVLSQVLKQTM